MKLKDLYNHIAETMQVGRINFANTIKKVEKHECTLDGMTDEIEWWMTMRNNQEYHCAFSDTNELMFVAITKNTILNGISYTEFLAANTYDGFAGNSFFQRFVYFLKTQKNKPVLIGNVISPATEKSLKKTYATGRFKMYWVDTSTNTQHSFQPDTIDSFTSLMDKTNNRLIIESSKPIFPRFREPGNYLSGAILFEDIE